MGHFGVKRGFEMLLSHNVRAPSCLKNELIPSHMDPFKIKVHVCFQTHKTHQIYKLYEHQKQLFTICKNPKPKLVLYIAPTGTGKTLSPLGLAGSHKIIFLCAARHVGLALAKSAISSGKKIAFAFGCNDVSDIRLHYFAAKDYVKHNKTGKDIKYRDGTKKVDNSVGDNVEIMICDIKSYLCAM